MVPCFVLFFMQSMTQILRKLEQGEGEIGKSNRKHMYSVPLKERGGSWKQKEKEVKSA